MGGSDRERRPLRIVMVAACPFPCPRGTPIRIFRLSEALGRRGHEVHVVTYHLGEPTGALPFRIHRIPNVPTYRRLTPGPTYQKLLILNALLRRKLRSVVRAHSIDVIHAHHYEGLLVALSVARGGPQPVVYDAHTLLETELPFYSLGLTRSLKRRLGGALDRALPGRAAHVIAVTERIRAQLLRLGAVAPEGVTVVMNGVEPDVLGRARPEGGRAGKTVVFAGNLAAYQGVDLLLRAFRNVRSRVPDARLLIVTEDMTGKAFEPYEVLARTLEVRASVEVVGAPFERLPPLLARADIAVNPRVGGGGVPQKLLNYMASGRPIVSFEGTAAHLLHGETGWLVPDGDVDALSGALIRLLEDPDLARRLGEAARAAVAVDYTWDRTAEGAEEVYGRVLDAVPRVTAPGPRR